MKYITSRELSEKWGISQRRIIRLAVDGRIQGANLYGKNWMFPEDAEKPLDKRTREGKNDKTENTDTFRFPSFEYRETSSFDPPLTKNEVIIKEVTEAFFACRFEKAVNILGDLPEMATDRYTRINALYAGCMADIYYCNVERFFLRYGRLCEEFQNDFPYKKEMEEQIRQIDASLGDDTYYSEQFIIDPFYSYHESFLPKLTSLCAEQLTLLGRMPQQFELQTLELACELLKKSESYANLVSVHTSLGIAYGKLGKNREMNYHLEKALRLAEKYEIYYPVAVSYYYWRKFFINVVNAFSSEYINKLKKLSDDIHNTYFRFMEKLSVNNIYKLVSHSDSIYIHYAILGLTNKEIAEKMNISIGTVGKRYGEIYALLGIKNKAELIELCNSILGSPVME